MLLKLVTEIHRVKHICCSQSNVLYDVFSCDQAAIRMVQSVCLSVCPSVRHTFLTMFPSSYHHEIFRSYYQWQNDVHAKGQGQRSEVKVTEIGTQLSRFRTVTLVWIHIWWWNDAQNLMLLRRGTMQGQNNWGNWGFPGVMKLWVAWEVLRWLIKFRELRSGGFHPKLVTPPYHGFLNVNTPPNSQNSKRHYKCNAIRKVPVGKHNNRQHASPHHEVATDVKQMPIRPMPMPIRPIIIIVFQGHPSNFKVTRLKKSSILTQIGRFRTVTPVWIHQWLQNDAQSLK